MQIKDIMTNKIVYVSPETNVEQIAQLMQKHNIGSVPVCDANGIVGIVTDRDIIVRNIATGGDYKTMTAKDIMTSQITTANPMMDIYEASKLMSDRQIRRLPIIENNRLIGMVSLGDLAVNTQFGLETAEALTEISTPCHPYRV